MGKFIKLENEDYMDVYVLKSDVRKVDVTGVDEEDGEETVDVYVSGIEECEVYQMAGKIGLAASLVAQLEQDDSNALADLANSLTPNEDT